MLYVQIKQSVFRSIISNRYEKDMSSHHQSAPPLFLSSLLGEALDEAVRRVRPSRVLELGMHCGYSSVRLLRLLPSAGRLITVELDPLTAELGEEIILVAGFKHSQVCPEKMSVLLYCTQINDKVANLPLLTRKPKNRTEGF